MVIKSLSDSSESLSDSDPSASLRAGGLLLSDSSESLSASLARLLTAAATDALSSSRSGLSEGVKLLGKVPILM